MSLVYSPDREEALLLRCLSGKADDDSIVDVRWPRFLELVSRHRVDGIVAKALATLDATPTEVQAALRRWRHANALSLLAQMEAIRGVQDVLGGASIDSVVIKGPANTWLYSEESDRHVGDLDILLLDQGSAWKAFDALHRAGWRDALGAANWSGVQRRAFAKGRKDISLFREGLPTMIELHWRAFEHGDEWPVERTRLATVGSSRVAGCSFTVLDDQTTALLLLLHGSISAWSRLKWLTDMLLLVRQYDDTELQRFVATAYQASASTHTHLLARLLDSLFDDKRLSAVLARMRDDGLVISVSEQQLDRLLAHVARSMDAPATVDQRTALSFSGEAGWLLDRMRYLVRLRPTVPSAMRRFRKTVGFHPVEWSVVPLPEPLHALYPLLAPAVRPAHLLAEHYRRRKRR